MGDVYCSPKFKCGEDLDKALAAAEWVASQFPNPDTIHHTGNKPSGSYTGNGDAAYREVLVGGIGHALLVYSVNGMALISPIGAIGQAGTAVAGLPNSECFFNAGTRKLQLATNHVVLNAAGVTYTYQVL